MPKRTCTHDVILWNAAVVTAAFIIMGHGATLKYVRDRGFISKLVHGIKP